MVDVTSYPHILEGYPSNQTVNVGATAQFVCRIQSSTPTIIYWFKEVKLDPAMTPKCIPYDESHYITMSSDDISVVDDRYISKLVLYNITLADAGAYVCIGISNFDVCCKKVYLNVLDPSDDFNWIPVSSSQHRKHDVLYYFTIFGPALGYLALLVIFLILIYCCLIKERTTQPPVDMELQESVEVDHVDRIVIVPETPERPGNTSYINDYSTEI
ncbi:fibroblast growth factor receptor-like 1 [Saccoglossus kowalevskii]